MQSNTIRSTQSPTSIRCLVEGRRSASGIKLLANSLRNTVRKGEFEVLGQELLHVWSLNIIGLLELNNLQDLFLLSASNFSMPIGKHTWIDRKRDRCLAAISWYIASTASVLDISRYSLYMLCVPERESYRIQIPKFLTLRGRFSWICKNN